MKIEYETGRKDYLAKILELCEEYVQENGRGAWSDGQWGAFEEVRDYVKYIQKRPGRPPTGFDKKAYMKEYMRKRGEEMRWKKVDKAKPTNRALLWVDDKSYQGAVMGRIVESLINGDDTLYFLPDGFHGDWNVTHFCSVEAPKPTI